MAPTEGSITKPERWWNESCHKHCSMTSSNPLRQYWTVNYMLGIVWYVHHFSHNGNYQLFRNSITIYHRLSKISKLSSTDPISRTFQR